MDENIGTEWWEMDAIYHYVIISIHCVIYQEWWIQVFPKVLMGNECQEHKQPWTNWNWQGSCI
jgi:hypothetical protein